MSKKANSASELPMSFMPCRAFRHELKFVTDNATKGPGNRVIEFVRHTSCGVCGTKVRTTYSVPDFRVVKRVYDYPDLYSVKGGLPVFAARERYIIARFGGSQ